MLRPFDPPARPWLTGHRGVDLSALPGQKVVAAGSGTVTFARDLAGRGVVSVTHANGLRTTYLPVKASVLPGRTVVTGDVLGEISPGVVHCAATCLHWGLLRGDDYLDPLLLVGLGQVRLLPLPPTKSAL